MASFWLALAGGAAWFGTHYFQNQSRENRAAEIRQQREDASFAALALKYNAVTNWEASLPDRGGAQPFSIDVSRALNIPANPYDALDGTNQPVLIKCSLNDVLEKDGKTIASLSSLDTVNDLSLELQCSPGQLQIFTSTNQLASFAVVVRCNDVQKLPGDNTGFSVKGELLDVIQLPSTAAGLARDKTPAEPDVPDSQ